MRLSSSNTIQASSKSKKTCSRSTSLGSWGRRAEMHVVVIGLEARFLQVDDLLVLALEAVETALVDDERDGFFGALAGDSELEANGHAVAARGIDEPNAARRFVEDRNLLGRVVEAREERR